MSRTHTRPAYQMISTGSSQGKCGVVASTNFHLNTFQLTVRRMHGLAGLGVRR